MQQRAESVHTLFIVRRSSERRSKVVRMSLKRLPEIVQKYSEIGPPAFQKKLKHLQTVVKQASNSIGVGWDVEQMCYCWKQHVLEASVFKQRKPGAYFSPNFHKLTLTLTIVSQLFTNLLKQKQAPAF